MPGEDREDKSRTIEDYKEQLRRDEQQKKLLETVEALVEKVDQVRKQQELFCDPKSGQCFVTRTDLETFLNEQSAKIPQVLGGHQDLSGLFRSLLKEGNKNGQDEAVQSRIPTELKVRWAKAWCTGPECRAEFEKQGIRVHDDEHPRRGAYSGSVR